MNANVQKRVNEVLDCGDNDEEAEIAKTEAIEALIAELGWKVISDCMFELLRDDSKARHWRVVTHVFWGAVLDRRSLPADELIAWLYHRFDPYGDAEDNEVWSITSKLKGKSYLSKYKPLEDPDVMKHLRAIRGQ